MQFLRYDYNVGVYDNVKNDVISKAIMYNRWGNKFKRLYKKHCENVQSCRLKDYKGSTSVFDFKTNDDSGTPAYDFTAGMRYSIRHDELPVFEKDTIGTFKESFVQLCSVLDSGIWSVERTKNNSYMAMVVKNTTPLNSSIESCEIEGFRLNLSIDEQVDTNDYRYKSRFLSYGANSTLECLLEPLDDTTLDTEGLRVFDIGGIEYGSYIENSLSPTYDTISDMFGVIDANVAFSDTLETDLINIQSDLLLYLKDLADETIVWDTQDWSNGDTIVIALSVDQFIVWLNDKIEILGEYIDMYQNDKTRLDDDLELIKHLNIQDTLEEEIPSDKKIKRMWFDFKKELSNIPMIKNPNAAISNDLLNSWSYNGCDLYIVDPGHQWWMRDEFKELRRNFPRFYEYCDVTADISFFGMIPPANGMIYYKDVKITLKADFLNLSGKKVYYLVSFFLGIGITTKKEKWWKRLLSFVLLIVGIVLAILSSNPVWLKLLIIGTSIAGFTGHLSPELALLVTLITLGYNLYNADFSLMSSMETFNFAIKNISLVVKAYGLYESIGLKVPEQNSNIDVQHAQYGAMEYIYTLAYSQYDELYNMLYNYNPRYGFDEA